jgi:hypothetical protein
VVCRYPTFLTYQLNPDEAQFLSAAHKLFWDGNFFRSVDAATSGPLNIYPLMLPAVFGFSPDFASSRVLALVFALCDIYVFYCAARLLVGDSVARLAIVPLVTAFAAMRHPNFLHYSSEQLPVLIVSVALYAVVSILAHPCTYRSRLLLLGLLVSAAFFAKLQAVPIVAVIGAAAMAYTYVSGRARRLWEPPAWFVAGAVPLFTANVVWCWAAGVWTDFWMSYIVTNQRYTEIQSDFFRDLNAFVYMLVSTIESRLYIIAFLAIAVAFSIQQIRREIESEQRTFVRLCLITGIVVAAADRLQVPEASSLRASLALFAMLAVPLYFLCFYNPRCFGSDPVRWFGLVSVLSIWAALYSMYKPHRPFPHYLLLLYVPLSAAMAWILIRQAGSQRQDRDGPVFQRFRGFRPVAPFTFVFLFVGLPVVDAACVWYSSDPDYDLETIVATVSPPEANFVRSLTSTNGPITVWGWDVEPYLGSGCPPATRDLNMLNLFAPRDEVAAYYRARFLHDLRLNPPELFIDAMGPTSWPNRDVKDFEQLPEIAAFIGTNYVRLAESYGQVYFVRRDLAARARSVRQPNACAPRALRCVDVPLRSYTPAGALRDVTKTLPAIEMPRHALIEVQFTPAGAQTANATIFNNEAIPHSRRGFRFQTIGDDRYRLILGTGDRWAFSKSVLLPPGKPALISIEMNETDVYIRANANTVDEMHLASPMLDAPGLITLGSWIDGYCRFSGTIGFFQIVDLTRDAMGRR